MPENGYPAFGDTFFVLNFREALEKTHRNSENYLYFYIFKGIISLIVL